MSKCTAFLKKAAEHGPASLPDNRSHHVSTEEPKIWQFDVTGTLRLLWFYDEGKMVVMTQSFYKPGGKKSTTPRKLVVQAQDTYRRYFEAKASGELDIVDEDTHEDQ
ncbi:type II toxin-antitoxin system RelE/ParE family toxin [Paraburkholderia sediminicola]|uniref:type II toxin-antitoxin system RelE/ParE family toxin n=1 Tax=Paraburkholderia sediminicola TaxID=458836 RepID=UPI0038B7B479